MNVEDPKVIQDAIDQATKNFGGIMNEVMERLEKLVSRIDGAMIVIKLGEPK
jgi:hypothetical protein